MKTRSKTLMQNVAIYVSLVVVVLFHGAIWGGVVPRIKADARSKEREAKTLESESKNMTQERERFEDEIERCRQILESREAELASYGNFLPPVKKKNDILQDIMTEVERLGLQIVQQSFSELSGSGSYYTFRFTLELKGVYQAFMLLLNTLQKTQIIIRIENFEVLDFGTGNPDYHWRARIQLVTYFSW